MENITMLDVLIPSNARIQDAENLRKKGLYGQAFVLVQGVLLIKSNDLHRLDDLQKRRFLSALRISFGSMFSLTKLEVSPLSLKAGLYKCREILAIYESTVVKVITSLTNRGIFDEPYDFRGEMARDIARFLAFLNELRGFGALSLTRNLEALAVQATEPSLKTLMVFEAAAINYEYTDSTASLGVMFQAAMNAIDANMHAQNYERVATISARLYALVSIRSFAEYAARSFDAALSHDQSVLPIWNREIQKPLKKRIAVSFRRIFFRLFPLDWTALSVTVT